MINDKLLVWVTELAFNEPSWTPERIALYVTRGWSFLAPKGGEEGKIYLAKHEQTKAEIIALVNEIRA